MDKRFLIGNLGAKYEKEIEEKSIRDFDKVLVRIEKLDSSKAVEIPVYFHWTYPMSGRKPQFIVMSKEYSLLLEEGFKDMEPIKLTILKVLK